MRIALFSDTYWPQVNGVALTLKRLADHLEHRLIPYEVFVPSAGEEASFPDHIQRVASLPFMLYPECRIALPNYVTISRQLQNFKPDLLHIATPFNMGLCGLFYGRKNQIPHVASYHTHFDRYLNYYHLQFAAPLLWRYIRWFHKSCLATFAPSRETINQLDSQGIQGLELWQRGVDCHLFRPDRMNQSVRERYGIQERYLLLYVGRLAPEKDLDILQEMMTGLPSDLQPHVHWMIVGDGPMLQEMKRTASSQVTFAGYKEGQELAELYAAADLFVFPSSTETFGNVALEALASGTPVLGARSGGVQEIVQHGRTGLLCPARDAKAFIEAAVSLIDQPEQLHDFSMAGRQYALSQSWEAIFDNLLLQYSEILHTSTASSKHNPFSA